MKKDLSSFDIIGSREKTVAIVEISDELIEKEKEIAKEIMKRHKNVKSVLKKVSERKGEFATLDAIGAPKSCIIRMVIIETGLIGLFGCVGGILLGVVAAVLMIVFYAHVPVSFVLPNLFVIVPPVMMLWTLASVVALSCITGIIPALIAARIRKTEELE